MNRRARNGDPIVVRCVKCNRTLTVASGMEMIDFWPLPRKDGTLDRALVGKTQCGGKLVAVQEDAP